MLSSYAIVLMLFAIKDIIKEKAEKPVPKGTRFDWNAYWKDIKNGIGAMEQIKKQESGGYNTTKPLPEMPTNGIVDVKRYEHDKLTYGEAIAEMWRKNGSYKHIRGF